MSDHFLVLLPTDPTYVPAQQQVARARALLAKVLREKTPEIKVTDEVEFICATALFERVQCPVCGTVLDMDWWRSAMDAAYEHRFRDLSVAVPCCGAATNLNDLDYYLPQGFARFTITYFNPAHDLSTEQVDQIAEALGHPLRKVWEWL